MTPRLRKAPVPTDFGSIGAPLAFPGALASSWGAALVEPPQIAALRRRASPLLTTLGQLAPPHSGIATRVVNYFMVQEITDTAQLEAAGIRSRSDKQRLTLIKDGRGQVHKIEKAALAPVVRRPGDLEGHIHAPLAATKGYRILYLSDDKDALLSKRWSHTLDYIRYGETTDFPAREGSRRRGGVPAERPQVRVRSVWFHVPRMETGPGRVCWLKGRGGTHYVPALEPGVLVPDNFLYSAPPADLAVPRTLAAVANLSFTHLMVEIFGRRSGGDGVLHTYIRELNMLPLIDPRNMSPEQAEELVALFDDVATRPVLALEDELQQPDRQRLDQWAMEYLFGPDEADQAARTVERALRNLASERSARQTSGRTQERKANRRVAFDPAPVAARLLMDQGNPPLPLVHFMDLEDGMIGTTTVSVEPHDPQLEISVGDSLFDSDLLLAGGQPIAKAPTSTHVAIVDAVLRREPGFSGDLPLPATHEDAIRLLAQLTAEWADWEKNIRTALLDLVPGPQRIGRRGQVLQVLERTLRIRPGTLTSG